MRFITWHMAISAWLLISAFTFLHTAASAALTALVAVLTGVVGLASPGLRGLRWANAVLALALGWSALLMDDVSWPARINNLLVAAAVNVLALVPGRTNIAPRKIVWLAYRNPAPPEPEEGSEGGRGEGSGPR